MLLDAFGGNTGTVYTVQLIRAQESEPSAAVVNWRPYDVTVRR
jgi:hypothetical protein